MPVDNKMKLTPPGPDRRGPASVVTLQKTSPAATQTEATPGWLLDSSRLEIIAPDGMMIPLSYNEYRILRAAASANGHPVSRKTLITALDEDFLRYDERRLEMLISRLRRKLAPHALAEFSVRAIKGHGYLFNVQWEKSST